jgi:hypothetical protein
MKGDFLIKTFIKKSPLTPLCQRGELNTPSFSEELLFIIYLDTP